jgi:tryptophan-rich sensory protein
MASSFFAIIFNTISQLVALIGFIVIVGFLLDFLQKQSIAYLYRTFNKKGYLVTAWIGTPIHEFGHVIMCLIFRHRINKVQWVPTRGDTHYLGFVEHSYNPRNIYQKIGNFFIGIGPFISGILSLVILMYFFVPESYHLFTAYLENQVRPEQMSIDMVMSVLISSGVLFKSLFTAGNIVNPFFWLFIFLATSISTHIALSKEDIKGAATGISSIFILLLLFNFLGAFLHFDSSKMISSLVSYHAYTMAFASLAILFSGITFCICFILYIVNRKIKRR